MSQEYNGTNKRHRRRSPRNRPVVITAKAHEQEASERATSVEEVAPVVVSTPPTESQRRLPRFFSIVSKNERSTEPEEVDVAQARLARATRGKAKAQPVKGEDTKVATTSSSTPPSLFKTRYFIGMAVYLLSATYIGGLETSVLAHFGLDTLLFPPFNLFGGVIVIRTSTLLFLATLILILVLLARFDLIPRSFGAATRAPAPRTGQSHNNTSQQEGNRNSPPAIKQGIKGVDDKLYQAYRTNQRREKKR